MADGESANPGELWLSSLQTDKVGNTLENGKNWKD